MAVGLEYTTVAVTCFFSQHVGPSDSDLVLVRESAEDLFSADPVPGQVDLRRPGVSLSRGELAEGTVRPGGVVMLKVFGQHPAGCQKSAWPVSCSDDQRRLCGMMIIRVSPPALSHLRAAVQLAGPTRPVISLQGRRAARAAA